MKGLHPAHVCDNVKIFTGCAVHRWKAKGEVAVKGKAAKKDKEALPLEERENKGDLFIRDLWTQGADRIHNMRVVNTDAVSYQSNTLKKCLETNKRKKKRKYLNTCLNKSRHFTPFVT